MTIKTRVQLYCDVGLKCTKQVAKTLEGPAAGQLLRDWAVGQGWGTWGDRDACPHCWKELHGYRPGEVTDNHPAGREEELQRAIEARRKAMFE